MSENKKTTTAKKLMLQWGTDGDTTIRVNLDNPVDTPDGEALSLIHI